MRITFKEVFILEMRDKNGLTEQAFLEQYRPGNYERPSMAADMVIFTVTNTQPENARKLSEKELRLLLIRRGAHPYLGQWALPGGFVRPTETAEQAAARELREETGVEGVYLEQLYTFTQPDRDPRTWVVSCAHMALIDSTRVQLQAGDDADGAEWFRLSYRSLWEKKEHLDNGLRKVLRYGLELTGGDLTLRAEVERRIHSTSGGWGEEFVVADRGDLAFDHARIIACAIERLRGKIEYTDIALHLMPQYFTLTELQQVYEVIWGRELLKAAFRRKIAPLVRETDKFTGDRAHRPSRLYRRNWEETE